MRAPRHSSECLLVDQAFETAMTPPGWVYHDSAVFQRDLNEIWSSDWLCVGHRSQFATPGSVARVSVADHDLLITCDDKHELRAMHNVCRHRGSRLVSENRLTQRSIVCPYHGWSYALDGRLQACPGMDATEGFDSVAYGLKTLSLSLWNELVFISLAKNPVALDLSLRGFPDLSHLPLDTLQCVHQSRYEVASNWKLIQENYNECYHCALAHPQLHRISREANFKDYQCHGPNFTGGPMALVDGALTLNANGQTARRPLSGTRPNEAQLVFYYALFPNVLLSIAPDYVLVHLLWPMSVGQTRVETLWLFCAEQLEDPAFAANDVVEFWETTNQQDWLLCENAMQGLRSPAHQPGRYHTWERCVHDFDRWYVRRLFSREG